MFLTEYATLVFCALRSLWISAESLPTFRLASLLSRSVLDPDRRSHKSECRTNLVLQETLIREMQLHGPIGKEDECWRCHRSLCHVENLHSLTHRNRGALKVHAFEKTVHLRSGDSLSALGRDFLQQRKYLFCALARLS